MSVASIDEVVEECQDPDFVKWIAHKYDKEYFDNLCWNRGWMLRRIVKKSEIINAGGLNSLTETFLQGSDTKTEPSETTPQVLHLSNHRSHFDYIQQMWNFWSIGIPSPRIFARENVFFWPFTDCWEKSGAVKLPFGDMDKRKSRLFRTYLVDLLNKNESFLVYPEGGRSKNGEIKEFETGGIKSVTNAAKKAKRNLLIVPNYIGYDIPPEGNNFEYTDKLKVWNRKAYQAVDVALVFRRLLYRSGKVVHAIGTPFPANEYSADEICEKARQSILEMKKKYSPTS